MRTSDETSGMEYRGLVDVLRSQRRVRLIKWRIEDGEYDEDAAMPTVVERVAQELEREDPA
jgi:hypothetical protein